jgi:hypothetical protein
MMNTNKQTLRSWTSSSNDFYKESIPPDDDPEEDEDEESEEPSNKTANFMKIWADAIRCGISDSEWENITIPKLRALNKDRLEQEKREWKMHGFEENSKPKKAKYLSDLGFFPKQ